MAISINVKKLSKKSTIIFSALAALLIIITIIAVSAVGKRPVQSDFFDTNADYVSGIDDLVYSKCFGCDILLHQSLKKVI